MSATQTSQETVAASNEPAPLAVEIPADLAALAVIWPKMPEHIRAAIMALVGTVKP